MVTCGTLVKIWTAAIVIATLVWTGTDGEKLSSCCKTVTRSEVTDPITGYWTQAYNAPCVRAVILETEKGLICCHYRQPWVRRKIQQFEMARRSSTSPSLSSSPPSLTSSPTTTSLPSSPPSVNFSPLSLTSTLSSLPSSPSLSSSSNSLTSTSTFLPSSPHSLFSSLFPASPSSPSVTSSHPSLSSSPSYLLSSLFPASSSPPSLTSSPTSLSSSPHQESTENALTQQSTANQ
ncbi:DNA-directed RNA polymerase II subunit rpb1 [Salmo salar]|uniref:DNA-directed RNA polymerase II subunit rpb1 n=1 Tax=Salmo salar TaxID=8030 RepID=A0ABM3DIG5_SALSA|nr:DNA-directed RNA polymerase II subunit rpb1 [Salmo salar]